MTSPSLTGQLETQLQRRRKYILAAIRSRRNSISPSDRAEFNCNDESDVTPAGLLSDAEIDLLRNKSAEPREIQAALRRIKFHTYGACITCGAAIESQRLRIHPTAERCTRCQIALENRQRQDQTPSF